MKKIILLLACFIGYNLAVWSHINPELEARRKNHRPSAAQLRSDCVMGTAMLDLEVNNVRARLQVAGDLWWDGDGKGRYIVPKIEPGSGYEEVSALFAAGVWLGGVDPAGNLKLAAQTYGRYQGISDFYPGPLTPDGQTNSDQCANWDRLFKVRGDSIRLHIDRFNQSIKTGQSYDPAMIPISVKGWPARGNQFFQEVHGFELPNTPQGLAFFFDRDGDGDYEPEEGDYPRVEVRGCDAPTFPDEMVFWIYNDAGGLHQETRGDAIQMELQATAFAYDDIFELENHTFYRYKLINRAIESIDSTYFAFWADPDLGCYTDDYIGCDPERNLAYVYNEDAIDGEIGCDDCPQGVSTYCEDIPLIGIDYLRGPLDENGDEIGMSSFIYYNNGHVPGTSDPGVPQEYYNYLTGSWRDGTPLTYGGTGYNIGSTDLTNYAFSDPPDDPTGWSMCSVGLPFGDRRMLQASGPFRLDPGAVNELMVGVLWVPDIEYPCPDIAPLLEADHFANKLLDNCFEIVDGPDAPDIDLVELDQEVVLVLSNDEITSSNAFESFQEIDVCDPDIIPVEDLIYNFEGYKVYQLRDETISPFQDLEDPDKARLVFQCDVENGISKLFNWEPEPAPNANPFQAQHFWTPVLKVEGTDEGIAHTISLTEDAFAEGSDKQLINHRKYYYTAVAYAYNNYKNFDQLPGGRITGQREQYWQGRTNVRTYTAIPRPTIYEEINTAAGQEPVITRLAGNGNNGTRLAISDEMRQQIFAGSNDGTITYEPNAAPIKVKIYNPFEVPDARFELTLVDEDTGNDELEVPTYWQLTNLTTGEQIVSERSIDQLNEQTLAEYGFSITVHQQAEPGDTSVQSNGAQRNAIIHLEENAEPWFSTIADEAPSTFYRSEFDFIRTDPIYNDEIGLDPRQQFTQSSSSAFYPYSLAYFRPDARPYITPAWIDDRNDIVRLRNPLADLNNVDVILTSDESQWSRCVVVETATRYYYDTITGLGILTEGNAHHFQLRQAASVGKLDANGDGLPDPDGDGIGMSWFPGYAVDVETGDRLNIFFGENSTYNGMLASTFYHTPAMGAKQIGNDMIWNPSDQQWLRTEVPAGNIYDAIAGGQHFIYVTKQPYDECAFIRTQLQDLAFQAIDQITWTALPLLQPGQQMRSYADGLIPSKVRIELRANSAYEVTSAVNVNNGYPIYQFSFEGLEADPLLSGAEKSDALAQINVFPNPYYGVSGYTDYDFSETIKITNLPAKCSVTIYTLDGKFVRQFQRDEQPIRVTDRPQAGVLETQILPDLSWDLHNFSGIKVASGLYLIHVIAPGYGERVLKWIGKVN